jgi:hypothetical protein
MRSNPFLPLRAKCSAWLVAAAFLCSAVSSSLEAGTYGTQAFTFANGTVNLGDGTVIASNDGTASVQTNALRLTANGTGSTAASFKLPDLDPGKEVQSFDVTYKLRFFASGTPADGYSLNFGNLPNDYGGGESGFAMQNGLVIAWDTYNNGGDAPSIEIFANGISVGNFTQTFSFDGTYRNVVVHWDSNGLDVTFNGVAICTNLATPGFVPSPGNRFGYSGRTGGATQDTYIDDLQISTTPATPIETGGPIISEFVANNGGSLEDEDTDTSDWIEIYNGQNASVNLSGWTLTNLTDNNTLWTFPSITMGPYQYLVVFASGKSRNNPALPLHTNFTLQREAGYLALVQPGGSVVASEFNYGHQYQDVSFGESGATRTIGYMYPATPGAKNTTNVAAGPPAEEIVYSREGGIITGAITLSITPPLAPGALVRYTTNNTEPTASSPVYVAPFNISNNTTIRARVFWVGHLPGPTASRTFIRLDTSLTNYNGSGQPFSTNLPIIVLDSFGVPVDSFTAVSNRGYRLTYGVVIAPNAGTGRATITDLPDFQGRSGTHVRGETSAGFPQRPYAWELWNDENQDKSASILGLPAESDWNLTGPWSDKSLMRDVLVFSTMRKLRSDYLASRTKFCEVFFNQASGTTMGYSASYRGIYGLREKIKIDQNRVNLAKLNSLTTQQPTVTGGYIFRKDKPDPDSTAWTTASPFSIPLASYDPDILNSSQFSYLQGYINTFQTALNGSNFADPLTGYAAYIEPDTFVDVQWFGEWTKQVDAYRWSTYYHKDRAGKIRAGPLWDFNISLGNADYATGDTPTGWLYDTSGTANGSGELWYPRLHQDPTYRLRHWDRYWELRRGLLATAAILGDIDANASLLLNGSTTAVTNNMAPLPPTQENAVMRHYRKYQRLGLYDWPNPPGYASRIYYNSNGNPSTGEVDYMKNWLQTRLNWLDDANRSGTIIYRPPNFSQYGGNVSAGTQLTMSAYTGTPPSGFTYATGTLYYTLDGNDPRSSTGAVSPGAQTYSAPITLNTSTIVKARLYNAGAWSPVTTAVFIVNAVPASAANVVLSEIHYAPAGPNAAEAAAGFNSGNDFEFIEFLNVSSQNVDLSGVTIADAVDFNFNNAPPNLLTLPPGGRVIVVGNQAAFLFRYGSNPNVKIAGVFSGNLSNGGELLTVRAANASLIAQFTWSDVEPWPVAADGAGYSMVLNNPSANPAYGAGSSWRPSAQVGGGAGLADSTPFVGNPTADDDADGHSNFLEYAVGTIATNPASRSAPTIAIAPYIVGGTTQNCLKFQFRRSLSAEANYAVYLSEDSSNWQTGDVAVTYVNTTHNGDGTATVTYRSTQPCDSAHLRMFMRLRVSQ